MDKLKTFIDNISWSVRFHLQLLKYEKEFQNQINKPAIDVVKNGKVKQEDVKTGP